MEGGERGGVERRWGEGGGGKGEEYLLSHK